MSTPLTLPRICFGDRLMRAWEAGDAEVLREAAADPYIPRITTVPSEWTTEAAHAYIERQNQRATDGVGYSFVIIDESGKGVGSIGLWIRDLDLGRASLGYWIIESARGSGLASASLVALSDWASSHLSIPRLELHIEPWNSASMRTAEKAGFVREGLLRSWQEVGVERKDMLMFARIRP